jgi:two-component system, chemotaxis family, protein-glutamate methylesterase/glutaminase
MNLIRVVVADDSPFVCRLLKKIIESTSEIEVIATVQSGEELLKIVTTKKPDVITLNSYLSDLKVLEVLSLVQAQCPTPTIIISGAVMDDSSFALAAIELGVVDFIFKFSPGDLIDLNQIRHEIISKIKISAQVNATAAAPETILTQNFDITEGVEISVSEVLVEPEFHTAPEVVIVVGASTDEPVVIQEFLEAFPENFPGSVVVVHPNISTALADLLGQQPALKVREAVAGERLESGMVYVSSGGTHLYINEDGIIDFSPDFSPEENSPHPSIDLTMKSIAKHYKEKARGILLTGIGQDGISGLRDIQSNGGRTYVQDPESCAINGMPQLAIEAGVVDHIAPPAHLARLVTMGY